MGQIKNIKLHIVTDIKLASKQYYEHSGPQIEVGVWRGAVS